MGEAFKIINGKKVAVPLKASNPDADGLYKLETTATIGDVTIDSVDIGICEDDSKKAVKYTNGSAAELSVDKDGKLWLAGYNLFDQIENEEDAVTEFSYNVDGDVEYIKTTSAIIDATLGGSYTAVKHFEYTAGVLIKITKSVEST